MVLLGGNSRLLNEEVKGSVIEVLRRPTPLNPCFEFNSSEILSPSVFMVRTENNELFK